MRLPKRCSFFRGSRGLSLNLVLIALACFAILATGTAEAQLPAPLQTQPGQAQPPVLKVQTEVVNVYAVVKGKHGEVIPDLTKSDFEITDNGVPQEIQYFTRQTDVPLTMGIMVDTSPSQQNLLPIEQRQAKAFLAEVMRPKDLAFVLRFDVSVELLQDFTPNVQSLDQAIDSTVINGGQAIVPGTFPSGQVGYTHLYDAIWLASSPQLMADQAGRKVLILLTDGQDEGSKETLKDAIRSAQKADVMVYSINIVDPRMYGTYNQYGGGYIGDSVLKMLSEQTGGEYIRVGRWHDTSAAFQEIARQLRTQYLLGYSPTDRTRNGSYHKIRVRVLNKNYRVQARQGYYAPAQ
ncbi:MAG: VWA domain-containing protein [Acidobacteriota bacterium]|nr:VWA domain-containing protein [Acidobacteriota bacterium]